MSVPTREEFDRLRAELAALRRQVRRPRRHRAPVPALCLALLVALVPLGVLAATPFIDLTGGVHDANIDAIYQAGITTGCDPTHYCPTANVTREEMASFLARTAGLGSNPPVANAKTLQGYAANGLTRVAVGESAAAVGLPVPSGTALIANVTLAVPGPGFVLVTGVTSVGGDGTAQIFLRDATNNTLTGYQRAEVASPVSTTNLAIQHVFTVTSAASIVYEMRGQRIGGTALVAGGPPGALAATITAIFIPFGATGGSTLAVP